MSMLSLVLYERRSNDDQRLKYEEIHGSGKPKADWPSHARRHRKRDPGIFY